MELAGVHYKGWMLRFNWMKRQISYQNRQQDDVSLKGLPDALRGAVWPSPARTVKLPVNSGNGRDPCY